MWKGDVLGRTVYCYMTSAAIESIDDKHISASEVAEVVIKNKHLFYTNNQIYSIHTRFKTNLHPPTANLTKFQKGVYYSAIKIFNNLPHENKDLVNDILPFRNAFNLLDPELFF